MEMVTFVRRTEDGGRSAEYGVLDSVYIDARSVLPTKPAGVAGDIERTNIHIHAHNIHTTHTHDTQHFHRSGPVMFFSFVDHGEDKMHRSRMEYTLATGQLTSHSLQ